MDDRYPDFWSESNWPRRKRRDPFKVRLVALLAAGALLTPLALLVRRNDGDVVTTGGLPGAAVALEPVLNTAAGPVTSAAAALVPTPEMVAGTLPPAVGAQAAAAPATVALPAAGAGTLPPTIGTLPAIVPAPPPTEAPVARQESSGGGSGGATPTPTPAAEPEPKPTTAPPPAPTPTPTTAPKPPAQYTSAQIVALIRQVFPDEQEEQALAVAWRESRHDPRAYNGWCCYGLFQIYFKVNATFLATLGITSAEQLYDPVLNTKAAFAMFQRSGWGPWGG